jgi:hypothetical protein
VSRGDKFPILNRRYQRLSKINSIIFNKFVNIDRRWPAILILIESVSDEPILANAAKNFLYSGYPFRCSRNDENGDFSFAGNQRWFVFGMEGLFWDR